MIIEYTSNLTGNPVQVVKQDVDYDTAELDPYKRRTIKASTR
jgi:hypothetical protein